MTLRRLLTAALVLAPLGCADRSPPPPPANDNSTIFSARSGPAPQPVAPQLKIDSAPPQSFGPFTIDGAVYSATATRFISRPEGDSVSGTRSVEIRDSLQRVVYSARMISDTDIANGWWNDVSVSPLEDASGRARALMLWMSSYPSAPATGESFAVVAPRGDSLRRLFTLDWFGNEFSVGAADSKKGSRLLPGDQVVSPVWMFFYEAKVALHVSLDCVPGSGRCLQIALPDSISGLARFPVEVATPRATDSSATVELFEAPLAAHGTQVTIPKGVIVEVLGGAGKAKVESDEEVQRATITSDWLLVRVNGHTGWISGEKAYRAIGLVEAG